MLTTMIAKAKANKIKTTILTVASILGAVSTIWGFRTVYDGLGLPRPAFIGEHHELRYQLISLELDYRQRALRNDLKNLRESEQEIADLARRNVPVPDGLREYLQGLQDSISRNRDRIRDIETQQNR
jgi:hypothetical protein